MKKNKVKQIIKEEVQRVLKEERQKEMQVLADKMAKRIDEFGEFLKKKGYNV